MAAEPQDSVTPEPTIHEASLASGPSGAVEWGGTITFEEAVDRRKNALNIVVRGDDENANRRLAGKVEAAVGVATRPQPPHTYSAGPHALPHFHQVSRTPKWHAFYETVNLKAKRLR